MGASTRNLTKIVTDALNKQLCDDNVISKLVDRVFDRLNLKLEEQKAYYETVIDDITSENRILHEKIDTLEQYSRRNCLRIFGVPEESSENIEIKVGNVFKTKLSLDIPVHAIDRCHRVGKKLKSKPPISDNSATSDMTSATTPAIARVRPRPIIVKFTSYRYRDQVIKSRKNLKGTNISIKEDVTKARLDLFKSISSKFGFRNAWTADGSIFYKCGTVIKKVSLSDDIDALNWDTIILLIFFFFLIIIWSSSNVYHPFICIICNC